MNDTEIIAAVAVDKFSRGYNCAQSVLYAFSQKLGLDPNVALRMATGFGAGIARRQEVCGAVSGGVLALSCKFGRSDGEPKERTEESYQRIQRLLEVVEAKHGSYLCKRLTDGCDLRTPEGQSRFKNEHMLDTICKPCVRTVVEAVNAELER